MLLLVVFATWMTTGLKAQGWEVSFGGSKEDQAKALVATADGGYLAVGYSESFGTDTDIDVYLVRTDADGNQLWAKVIDEGFREYANDVIALENGDFLIVGSAQKTAAESTDVYLIKVSAAGKQIWSRTYGKVNKNEEGQGIIKGIDGGYIIVGTTKDAATNNDDALVIKVDESGQEMWSKQYGGLKDEEGKAIAALNNGYVFVGSSDNVRPNSFDKDIIVYWIDTQGDTIRTKRHATDEKEVANDVIVTRDGFIVIAGVINDDSDAFLLKLNAAGGIEKSTTIGGALGQEALGIVELPNGNFAVTGYTELTGVNLDVLFAIVDKNFNHITVSNLGQNNTPDWANDIVITKDGGFAIAGYSSKTIVAIDDMLLIKTDSEGNTRTNYITGQVFFDRDGACDLDPSDPPLKEWLVQVTGETNTYFGTTDENGRYRILADTGKYNVTVLPATRYWESCISGGYNVNLTNFYDTTSLTFPMTVAQACPYLEVDISTPFLTVCSDVKYNVDYCNLGTSTAVNAYVEVTLDEKLSYVSSSIPFSIQKGSTYTFPLGNIIATNCGGFSIETQMACNGIAEGQATLVQAHIYPDTVCLEPGPNWDGSSITVSGECQADSIYFRVKNVGQGNMVEPRKYYVVQEDIMFRQNNFKLPAGQELIQAVDNTGKTYRFIAEQSADHPGKSYPSVAIEGCASDGQPTSTGYVTQFPEDDQDNFIDTDVQEIIGSISAAAELRGYPKGYQDSLITANTEITYKVFFKNAGADTIRRVVIRDTLSPNLNLATLSLGTSSHPYKFELTGNGVLKITFDNIELIPDGSASGTSNWGFVNFRISQKPNNTTNTLITNRAAIYFNYTAPVQTNEVRHVVDSFPKFVLIVDTDDQPLPGVKIKVSPNPFTESVKFEIEAEGRIFKELTFNVYDAVGRQINTQTFSGNQFMYYRDQLTPGIYFYRLESEGQLLNSGKLLIR